MKNITVVVSTIIPAFLFLFWLCYQSGTEKQDHEIKKVKPTLTDCSPQGAVRVRDNVVMYCSRDLKWEPQPQNPLIRCKKGMEFPDDVGVIIECKGGLWVKK